MEINNQYDFFKFVNIDENGNLGVVFSGGGGGSSATPFSIVATNRTDLLTKTGMVSGDLAYVEESEGTQWLPGSGGGTYYPAGLYLYNGTNWVSDRNAIALQFNLDDSRLDDLETDKLNVSNPTFTGVITGDGSGLTNLPSTPVSDGDKGDITVSSSGSTWTVDNDAISFDKIQNISTNRFLGRSSSGVGSVQDLTATQATALLSLFNTGNKGLVPASGGGTTNFLRADGTFAAPSGGSSAYTNVTPATGFAVAGAGFQTCAYSKDTNTLYLTGLVTRTGAGLTLTDTLLFTLPVGYRPSTEQLIHGSMGSTPDTYNGTTRIRVKVNGDVTASNVNFTNTSDTVRINGIIKL